ncbi:hypothetical protein OESDEN_03078 [Oesophagostomum dentatum]|uniref:Pao retrotransposon peptidase n=1 Tax=Oesophagostomum dentatum TaxID=61180 RepID=A0A0B1THA8_OESDE|nr:hypothetical protein OESDEN_03078 [Oesophagostomum dentatum]
MFLDLNVNLREFNTNDQELMKKMPDKDKTSNSTQKLLGITWDAKIGKFLVECKVLVSDNITKRTVTSATAAVYDPMGWFLPILLKAKIFLHNLGRDRYDWDKEIKGSKRQEWEEIVGQANGFQKSPPRCTALKISLATSADVSTNAMCVRTYLLTDSQSHLLIGKSKLASLQHKTTMPKHELNAFTLAARLTNSIFQQLSSSLSIRTAYVFSDSEITLNWIKSKPQKETGIFTFNRLCEIYHLGENLKSQGCQIYFGYVSTQDNPADCGTRGLKKNDFRDHFWWTGPKFLTQERHSWPAKTCLLQSPKSKMTNHSLLLPVN